MGPVEIIISYCRKHHICSLRLVSVFSMKLQLHLQHNICSGKTQWQEVKYCTLLFWWPKHKPLTTKYWQRMKLIKIKRRVKDVSSLISGYDRLSYNYHNRVFLVLLLSHSKHITIWHSPSFLFALNQLQAIVIIDSNSLIVMGLFILLLNLSNDSSIKICLTM